MLLELDEQLALLFEDGEQPHFRRFRQKDVNPLSGQIRYRIFYAPNKPMRKVHTQIKRDLRYRIAYNRRFATAFEKGSSPVHHILPHRYNRYFYVTDLHQAYQHVDGLKLAALLNQLTNGRLLTDETNEFLEKYCLAPDGGIATGAPASPALFNLYAGEMLDKLLAVIVEKFGLVYTRYSDDLVFSSAREPFGRKKCQQILSIIRAAGFDISHHKTGRYDLAKGRINLCGFGLELGGRIYLPRHFRLETEKLLHQAVCEGLPISPHKLLGHIGLFRMSLVNQNDLHGLDRRIYLLADQFLSEWKSIHREDRRRRIRMKRTTRRRH